MSADIRILAVVPVYNHGPTLAGVVRGLMARASHILVVDDGSADAHLWGELPFSPHGDALAHDGKSGLFQEHASGGWGAAPDPAGGNDFPRTPSLGDTPPDADLSKSAPRLYLERHERNRGKGAALLTAARFAARHGFSHMVTLDADGQHDPADYPLFERKIREDALCLWMGARNFSTDNVPFSSRFGRAFSNFWVRLETGLPLTDTQSGFRAYPVALLQTLSFTERRYSFEVEVLARAAWAGFRAGEIPVSVHYPPAGERVSHFRVLYDNLLISLLHTRLVIRASLPIPGRRVVEDETGRVSLLRPVASLKLLVSLRRTPRLLGLSAALGFALSALPLVGLHTILILWATGRLRLNKPTALAAGQLCIPPVIPAVCVEVGHYLRHGRFLTETSWQTLGYEAPQRIWEWILGSLPTAVVGGVLIGGLVFAGAWLARRSITPSEERT